MRKPASIALLLSLATPGPAFDSAAFTNAVELYTQHKPLEAQKAFEVLAETSPDNASIQFYLGRLALQRDDYAKATAYLEKAVALSPDDSRMHQRLGDAYGRTAQKSGLFAQLGWARKCKDEYEKAIQLDPKNIDARLSLMRYYQQAPDIAGGGADKALIEAQEIKKIDAGRGRIAVASVYAAGKKFDRAFAEFEAVLQDNPNDYAANFQFGLVAEQNGQRLDAGLAALGKCLAQAAPPDQPGPAAVRWHIGRILAKKGDRTGARAAYEAALKADPGFSPAAESLEEF